MKLSDTKEYQDFLSVLKNVENEGLRVVLEDSVYELVNKAISESFVIGHDVGYSKGFERGKDIK